MKELEGSAVVLGNGPAVGRTVSVLVASGMEVRDFASSTDALRVLVEGAVDLFVADAALGATNVGELIATAAQRAPGVPVVLLVDGGVEAAIAAVRAGAEGCARKPVDADELVFVVGKALAARNLDADSPPPVARSSGLVFASKAMQQVEGLVRRAAHGDATVLVRGESGTGKELVARALHEQSERRDGPFVKIHCAALPDALLESELFGYEKGAFTGATARKPGRVEVAQGGTLFLDEIGDITSALQVKLLRLLQDREYERLGSTQTLRADVRFVAATHRDLEAMVKHGQFREDLFYRLNVVPIWLPPLRARRDDVELLVRHFCRTLGETHAKPGIALAEDAIAVLRSERWPGNVRQLQNFVERLVVLSDASLVTADDVRRELTAQASFATQASSARVPSIGGAATAPSVVGPLSETVRAAEKQAIERALRHAKGNRTLAARLLGVSRATLYNKLEEHGLA